MELIIITKAHSTVRLNVTCEIFSQLNLLGFADCDRYCIVFNHREKKESPAKQIRLECGRNELCRLSDMLDQALQDCDVTATPPQQQG